MLGIQHHGNRSVMKHQFSQVPKAEIPRSTFDRSHGHKTTFDAGYLVPIFCDEALPGDTFSVDLTAIARLATPIAPLMDNIHLDVHFFSVPIRLVWDNWQRFNGEQKNPGDSTDFTIPETWTAGGYAENSLGDYFGLPTSGQGGQVPHNALPLRCYNLIFNEWYRDQNLQNSVTVPTDDGPDNSTYYNLLRRGKRHDYFTSALPWPQKGPGVSIPLGTRADVKGLVTEGSRFANPGGYYDQDGNPIQTGQEMFINVHSNNQHVGFRWDGQTTHGLDVYADLTNATAATINSLRQAFQIQKIFERDARGGTRYTELLRSHFGVTSPDARLQRPEYLGGGTTSINIQPIPQTSPTGTYADTPQGNLAAVGFGHVRNNGFTASFTEHCYIIGIISARADLTYQQGLNRMWSRKTRFDFYWPALAHIGEQTVLQKELFAKGIEAEDDKVFGYQERYAEYRYKPSMVTGSFRSVAAQPLDVWHLAQEFATAPVLDSTFIQENPPIDRVIAVQDEPHFLLDCYFKMKCTRPMPTYGVPGLIDHF